MEGQKTNPLAQALSPFSILSAFGLLSFSRDVISWQQDLLTWLDAWRAFTHLVTDYLFGWIPLLINMPFPSWAHDYLALSVIIFGATTRSLLLKIREFNRDPDRYGRYGDDFFAQFLGGIIVSFIWPAKIFVEFCNLIFRLVYRNEFKNVDHSPPLLTESRLQIIERHVAARMWVYRNSTISFFSSFVWAAIIIAINYALIFKQ